MRIGIDFGTTNTVIAWQDEDGAPHLWQLPHKGEKLSTYRSVLYAEPEQIAGRARLATWAGPAAIDEYNEFGDSGRLLQSLKSHLASPQFTVTNLFGTNFSLEQLVARFLTHIADDMKEAGLTLSQDIRIGRPVRFVGEKADEALAIERLTQAFTQAGATTCTFVEEPIAAAYAFAQRASEPGKVLIADIGGGTTDYAVVDITKVGAHPEMRVIATGGVGVAGDDLDAAIIDNVVVAQLGRDTKLTNGQEVPRWLYEYVRRWHHLSFLKTPQTLELINSLIATSAEPDKIRRLQTLVTQNQGFALAQAVGATKIALSGAESAAFTFKLGDDVLSADVARGDFEQWIMPSLRAMGDALTETLAGAGIAAGDIRHAFLTGGTSYVPAVYGLYKDLLPAAELHRGAELTSVAAGLALAA